MKYSMKNKAQQGFTLIELVVVIVILGILAVTAAPKFINLQDDAQTATMQGVEAALSSASALVHSKSLIEGNEDESFSGGDATAIVTVNGAGDTVQLEYGYPDNTEAEWNKIVDLNDNDFTFDVASVANTVIIYPANKVPADLSGGLPANDVPSDDVNCIAYYTMPVAVNTEPTISHVPCI